MFRGRSRCTENRDNSTVSEQAIDDFLEYELLGEAYEYRLINNEMAIDAFGYDLKRAMADAKIRKYIIDASRRASRRHL
jgi:hypothetical protein